jgi:hypothetical protein
MRKFFFFSVALILGSTVKAQVECFESIFKVRISNVDSTMMVAAPQEITKRVAEAQKIYWPIRIDTKIRNPILDSSGIFDESEVFFNTDSLHKIVAIVIRVTNLEKLELELNNKFGRAVSSLGFPSLGVYCKGWNFNECHFLISSTDKFSLFICYDGEKGSYFKFN